MNTRVFENAKTFASWDESFYHPVALQLYDRAIPVMLEMLDVRPADVVLDAGCGVGVHSIRVAKYGCRVHALDISSIALALARQRAIEAGVRGSIALVRGDLVNLGFRDASFAAIFAWGVIIHIPDIERALDELVRILKPGGRLGLYLTNSKAWDHFVSMVARVLLGRRRDLKHRSPMGLGSWYEMHGEKLWIWQIDVRGLTAYLESRGLRRTRRVAGEFTQLHVHLPARLRPLLFHANNAWRRLRLPPWPAATNLIVFEKSRGGG